MTENVANNVAQRNSQDNELMKKIFPHKEIIEGESVLVFPYIEEATPLKDVPQEVVSHMEKTIDHISQEGKKVSLTEQWKKGKLVRGCLYYVKLGDSIAEVLLDGDNDFIYNGRIITPEVLAEVPDYIEWKNYVNGYCEEHEYNLKLSAENAKLKELLKECREVIEWYKGDCGYKDVPTESVLTKINEALK